MTLQSNTSSPSSAKEMISISQAVISYWKHLFNWSGRASRAEVWYCLFTIPIFIFILKFLSLKGIALLVTLLTIPGFLSLSVRRLHDMGKSGRYLWKILFYSLLGTLSVFIILALLGVLLNAMGLELSFVQNIRSALIVIIGYITVGLFPFVLLGGIAPILGFFPPEKQDNQYGPY